MLSFSVLAIIGGVGLAFLLLMLLMDDVFDIFGGEPVLPGAAFFTAIFGFSGALATQINDEPTTYFLVPAIVALVLTAIFYVAYRKFKEIAQEDEAYVPDPNSMVGTTAKVLWWNGDSGEVLVQYLGHKRKMAAVSISPLKSTQTVVVTNVIGDSRVHVELPE